MDILTYTILGSLVALLAFPLSLLAKRPGFAVLLSGVRNKGSQVRNRRSPPFADWVAQSYTTTKAIQFGGSMTTTILAILVATSSHFPAKVEAQNDCRQIVALVSPPRYAHDYPLPLSLRRNLVFLVQRKMAETGEYKGPIDGVYHLQLEAAVRRTQQRLGEDSTGCLTWSLIEYYAGSK